MALHGIVLHCMISVLHSIVLHGIACHCIVLYGIEWYCMILYGIALYRIKSYGIVWYCMVLHCRLQRAGCISQDTYLLYEVAPKNRYKILML